MIRSVDTGIGRLPRVLWSFWIACGLAATGGIAPILLGIGGPNRLAFVFVPFAVAAIAMAVGALMYQQGKALVTALYFVTGLAVVYGMLAAFTLPLRLAVETTCPAEGACPPGLEQPLSSGEGTGLTIVILFGALTIVTGFFGLLMLYRSRPKHAGPVPAMQARAATPATEPESPAPAIKTEPSVTAIQAEPPVHALKAEPPRESPASPQA
jgi:hypothetical protein